MDAFSKKSPAEINESWTMAGKNPVNEVPYLGPSLQFPASLPRLKSGLSLPCCGGLGKNLNFPEPQFMHLLHTDCCKD